MKNFSQIRAIKEENDADEFLEVDDEEEATKYEPRSKNDKFFVDLHKVVKHLHPVAKDNQFKSNKKALDHSSGESSKEASEPIIKQGSSKIETSFQKLKRLNSKHQKGEMVHIFQEDATKYDDALNEVFTAGTLKLKDGASVKVTNQIAEKLNNVFDKLDSNNKAVMEKELYSNRDSFDRILKFAEAAK